MLARLKSFFDPRLPESFSRLRAPARIFWVALIVRVAFMTLAHTYRFRAIDDHFQFGWEAGRIGHALATGFGYADPFSNPVLRHTGPTAWLPPVYPFLIGAVFKLFGVYTSASAWVLLTINCILSAATAQMIWEIAARCFNRRVALWSAWMWALYPAAMQYAVRWVWEMTLTTALFTCTIVLALRMAGIGNSPASIRDGQTRRWVLFGFLWALIALCNTSLLIFLPVAGLWILAKTWKQSHSLTGAILAGLVFLAVITPWEIRNYKTFHAFVPIRGNVGVEMYLGNGPGSTGWEMGYDHPFVAPSELRSYYALGEVNYAKARGDVARQYIAAHPGHFLAITALRVYFFWASTPHPDDVSWSTATGRILNFSFLSLSGIFGLVLALHARVPAAGLFAWAFLLLPIPYYLISVQARFRHPLEPLICILAVYLFQSAQARPRPAPQSSPGAPRSRSDRGVNLLHLAPRTLLEP
jgi:4-amino-4-deoxy-L-arabinose transferase-like glycosyltransferase